MSRPSRVVERCANVWSLDSSAVAPVANWDAGWSADTIALKNRLVQDIADLSQPEKEAFTTNIQAFFNRARVKGLDERIEVDGVLKSCDRLLKPGSDELFLDRLSGKENTTRILRLLPGSRGGNTHLVC
jgi:hypothetical protein